MDEVRALIKRLSESEEAQHLTKQALDMISDLYQQLQQSNDEKAKAISELVELKEQIRDQERPLVDIKFAKLKASIETRNQSIGRGMNFWNGVVAEGECSDHGVTEEYATEQVRYFSAQDDLARQLLIDIAGINQKETI